MSSHSMKRHLTTGASSVNSLAEAYRSAALGSRADIQMRLRSEQFPARDLLRAVAAQYDGDVDTAVRILKTLLRSVDVACKPFVADILAPIMVMRRDMKTVSELIGILKGADWLSSAEAFTALVAADAGDKRAAVAASSNACGLLESTEDDVTRVHILQRLALASYYVHDYDEALNLAMSCARFARQIDAWRSAAAAYSIAYTIKLTIVGELPEADRFARLWHEAAIKSTDESFVQAALVAEFELAVQLGDVERFKLLGENIKNRLLPAQYDERFTYMYFYAVATGWGDLRAMRTLMQVLGDTKNRTRIEISACHGLIALAYAAEHEDTLAKKSIAAATESLGRPRLNDRAYEKQIRRFARASIAAAWVLLGEQARAQRVVATHDAKSAESINKIPTAMLEGQWSAFPEGLRGVSKVFEVASKQRIANDAPAGLTRSEFEILSMLASGLSAREIASMTDRSIHTIYNHTQAVLAKLDVPRASQAIALARKRGFIR